MNSFLALVFTTSLHATVAADLADCVTYLTRGEPAASHWYPLHRLSVEFRSALETVAGKFGLDADAPSPIPESVPFSIRHGRVLYRTRPHVRSLEVIIDLDQPRFQVLQELSGRTARIYKDLFKHNSFNQVVHARVRVARTSREIDQLLAEIAADQTLLRTEFSAATTVPQKIVAPGLISEESDPFASLRAVLVSWTPRTRYILSRGFLLVIDEADGLKGIKGAADVKRERVADSLRYARTREVPIGAWMVLSDLIITPDDKGNPMVIAVGRVDRVSFEHFEPANGNKERESYPPVFDVRSDIFQ